MKDQIYQTPEVVYLSLADEGVLCASGPMQLPETSWTEEIVW